MRELTREFVEDELMQIGGGAASHGFRYIVDAMMQADAKPELLTNVMKGVYATVADANGSKAHCVERCIRSEIERIYGRGGVLDLLPATEEPPVDGAPLYLFRMRYQPTNKEFLNLFRMYLKRKVDALDNPEQAVATDDPEQEDRENDEG